MMTAMVRGPPERSSLNCSSTNHSEKKLNETGGLKSFMRKVTVIETCDREHANGKKRDTYYKSNPTKTYDED
jgi:hypothetical protein